MADTEAVSGGGWGDFLSGITGMFSSMWAADDAKKAGRTQEKMYQLGQMQEQRQFDTSQENLAPWLSAGGEALNQQRILLGLGGRSESDIKRQDIQSQIDELTNRQSAYGQYQDRSKYMRGSDSDQVTEKYQGIGSQIATLQEELASLDAQPAGPTAQEQQQAAYDNYSESPGQKFLRDRGEKATMRHYAGIGGLGGGGVRSALNKQGIGFAAQDFGNYYNRLAGMSNTGQTTNMQVAQLGANNAARSSESYGLQGNARASGILGSRAAKSRGFEQLAGGIGSIWGGE